MGRQVLRVGLRYTCGDCGREIGIASVEALTSLDVRRASGSVVKAVEIVYDCECSTHPHKRTFRYEPEAYKRMVGELRPVLPYRSFGPSNSLMAHDQDDYARFVAEVRSISTVAEMGFRVELGSDD